MNVICAREVCAIVGVMSKQPLSLIVHNVRSAHNVGSMLRSADGFGLDVVYLCGYTPYPPSENDDRLPYISRSVGAKIHKTALGAEKSVKWERVVEIRKLINKLKNQGYKIVALDQQPGSRSLAKFMTDRPVALVVGREIGGIDENLLSLMDEVIEIPMKGKKDSFNVAVAAAVAMYKISRENDKT